MKKKVTNLKKKTIYKIKDIVKKYQCRHEPVNIKMIAEETHLNQETVRAYINTLEALNIIESKKLGGNRFVRLKGEVPCP